MRTLRLSACQVSSAAGRCPEETAAAGVAVLAELAAVPPGAARRSRSVTTNALDGVASNQCRPALSESWPPGAHSRTWTGRDWSRSATVPLTSVEYCSPSTLTAGPCPQVSRNLA